MTRIVDAGVAAALLDPHLRWAVFADLSFVSGNFRAFNGIGEYTYNGQTYYGMGKAARIGKIVERANTRDFAPLSLELSGIPSDLLLDKVPDRADYFNRPATIYFAVFSLTTNQPVASEPAVYAGFMDQLIFKREGRNCAISVVVRHHSTIWANTIGLLYTHEHQRLIDSTDNALNQVHDQHKELVWGGYKMSGGGGGGGGSRGGGRNPRQLV